MATNNKQGYPGLAGITDPNLNITLRALWDAVSSLKGRGGSTVTLEGPVNVGGHKISNVADPSADSDVVTKGFADANYSAEATRLSLQLLNGAPIAGVVTTNTGVPAFYATHATRIGSSTHAPSAVPDQSLFFETDRNAIYQARLVAGVPAWVYVGGLPFPGTISPDQKPTDLGTNDAGFSFFSTDFNRPYRWTGSAWADDIQRGAPQRGMIVYFSDTAPPEGGSGVWQLCDGTATNISTATGGTAAFTVPDLTTTNLFIRSTAGATGGTGGTATHTHDVNPPNTTSGAPSATTEVQSGTGVDVASDTHTHDTDIAVFASAAAATLPPYGDYNPYMRL